MNITKERFLKNTNEDEVFSLICGFLERAREKGFFKIQYMKGEEIINSEFLLTDKQKSEVIKSYLEDFQTN